MTTISTVIWWIPFGAESYQMAQPSIFTDEENEVANERTDLFSSQYRNQRT